MEEREKLRAKWRDKEDDDVRMYANPVDFELLYAATVCAQALSCSKVDDKVRFHTLSKVLDGLGGDNIVRKLHYHPEVEQHVHVQESCLGDKAYIENAQESSQKMLKEGCVQEGQEHLLSFLNKAMAQGALVLHDMDSVLHCWSESGKEVWKRKETAQQDESEVHIPATDGEHEQLHVAGNQKHSTCSKERDESLSPMGKDPSVITQVWVPQKTTVPTKGTLASRAPLPGDQGRKGQLCLHVPHCMADEKDKVEPHTQPQTRTVHSCSDMPIAKAFPAFMENSKKGVRGDFFHGNHSLSPLSLSAEHCRKKEESHVNFTTNSLNFLEATKRNLKSPSENASQQGKGFEGKQNQTPSHSSNGSPIFKIDQRVLHKRMEMCRFSVLGKVTLAKGEEPWTWVKLKDKLDILWGLKSQWRLISLGKGFFHIILSNQEEHDRVWSKEVLRLKPGVLRLQRWNFGFDPSSEKTTNAQVWFRIHHLPWCLWDASVISGIARKIGEPLRIDQKTLEGNFGHYARVLVEVDLSKPIMSSILVDCSSHVIEVNMFPESLPLFCRGCNSIGHTTKDCRLLLRMENKHFSVKSMQECTKVHMGNRGDKREIRNDEPIDASNDFCAGSSSKRSAQQSEWRRKKVHVIEKEKVQKEENSDQKHVQHITETVTDFSAQVGAQSSKDSRTDSLVISNQFAALETVVDAEDIVLYNSPSSSKEDQQGMDLNFIQQDDSFGHPGEAGEVLFPKIPEKWSDILDEEEKIDKISLPRPRRTISEIRENLNSLFMDCPSREMDLVEPDLHVYPEEAYPP